MRMQTYRNYTNIRMPQWPVAEVQWPPRPQAARLPDYENYFRFGRMDFRHDIRLSHFQLRNLIASSSSNHVFYAGTYKIHEYNPLFGTKKVIMNLSDPTIQSFHSFSHGIQISTLAADHNLLIAGGFYGEYGMVALDAPANMEHTEGLITHDPNSITNHIQINLSRHSGLPQAVFASNDSGLRTLDCTTNAFVAEHKYDYPINCTAISPDHRLRCIVGDTRNVTICNAETGEILQELEGHRDYGFSCAWADNGWHVATGNQDMMVKIWDARMWTNKSGRALPIAAISADMAGVRSLRFSPLGSGKRVLVAAEPADIVSVIDAESYESKQNLDFFGEIGGTAFAPDGQDLFVANCDDMRGGIMEYKKCGFGEMYAMREAGLLEEYNTTEEEETDEWNDRGLDWKKTEREVAADRRSMRTLTHMKRRAANLGDMNPF